MKKPSAKTKISSVKIPSREAPEKAKPAELEAPLPRANKTVIAEPKIGPTEPKAAATPSPLTVEAKFKAAQEKANRDGVQTLTQGDIEGLSYDQIKELRGY